MESNYPYRVAWQKPAAVNVHPKSRRAVLEAMEYAFPTSRRRLAALTELGTVTFRRAYRQLIREKVLILKYGRDPDSQKACDLITYARYPVLPILELTEKHMIWRLCDTLGESVCATMRERSGFCTAEDDLNLLMGQVSAMFRSGACKLPKSACLQPPFLLLPSPDRTSPHAPSLPHDLAGIRTLLHHVLDTAPAGIITPEEAVAHELGYHPSAREAARVLHLCLRATPTVTLLTRERSLDPASPLTVSPRSAEMNRALQDVLAHLPLYSAVWQSQFIDFLAQVFRVVTPQFVAVESPGEMPVLHAIRDILPPQTALQWTEYALHTPCLAHKGALRHARRALWESMISPPPQTTHV